jgi:hypothetical protein
MSVGIEDAAIAIDQMKGKWTADELSTLYRLVACSWVDLQAADIVKEAALGDIAKRNVGLAATKPELVELFGIRTFGQMPNDANERWWVAQINAIFGESAGEELKKKIRAELCEVIGTDEDDLDRTLSILAPPPGSKRPQKPVFVSMQASAFPKDLMTDLRVAFGGVTYFFLTGNTIRNASVFDAAGVRKICPDLDAGDEKAFAEQYNDNFTWLSPKARKRSSD